MALKDTLSPREAEPSQTIVLTFPGQGTQRVGMGQELVMHSPHARRVYDEADRILDIPVSRLSFEGPEEVINQTGISQPLIFVNACAWLEHFRAEGKLTDQPIVAAAGHSLGEYAAAVATGAIPFREAALIVRQRGILMQRAGEINKGGLVALAGRTEQDAQTLKELGLTEALYNAPVQITYGGPSRAIEAASSHFGRRLKKLPVSCAPHTSLMEPAVEPFAKILERANFNRASIPIVPNSTAEPVQEPQDIKARLLDQLTKPVLWMQTLVYLDEKGVQRSINVGEEDTTAKLHVKTIGGAIAGTLLTVGGAVGAYVWHKHHSQ